MNIQYQIIVFFLTLLLVACGDDEPPLANNELTVEQPTSQNIIRTTVSQQSVEQNAIQTTTPAPPFITQQPEQNVTLPTDAVTSLDPQAADLLAKQMTSYLENLANSGRFMGSILVSRGNVLVLNEGFGFADVEAGIPNSPEHQYRIGSLTKQFTAAAILLLQEDGLLSVQDPIQNYLPQYPNGDQITIHHLLTHTAGIPNYEQRRDLPQVVQTPISLDDLIASFSGQPLLFTPGGQYSYSSSGYVVLTKIIEVVSGKTYEDFIQERIFSPAGMFGSGYDYLDPSLPNPSVGYMLTQRGTQRANLTDSSWPSGAGALYSTTADLYLWDRLLHEGKILSRESIEMMHTPWADTGQGTFYGYGWDIGNTVGHPSIAHGGGIFGFASYMLRFPEDDAVIIVLSNGIQMPPRLIAEELARILFSG